jgi:hypothetical protein
MRFIHGLLTFAAVIICRALSWILILFWQLPVHYTELQTEDKLKSSSSCYDLAMFRLCSGDTHTFFDDVVSRVDTPVIPEVFYTNGEKKSNSNTNKTRPKSWWSSEERSATMELSYLTAVVDSKLVLFSTPQGVEIKKSSPLSTPREHEGGAGGERNEERKTIADWMGSRDRSHARDWDARPEVVKKSKGRFQLKGGKNVYTEADLAKTLERHRTLSRKTRRGFSGWSRYNTTPTAAAPPVSMSVTPPSQEGAPSGDSEHSNLLDHRSNNSPESQKNTRPDSPHRRGTAILDYHDFIPSKKPDKLSMQFSHLPSSRNGDDSEMKDCSHEDLDPSSPHSSLISHQHPHPLSTLSSLPPHLNHMAATHKTAVQETGGLTEDDDDDMVWEVNPSRRTVSS